MGKIKLQDSAAGGRYECKLIPVAKAQGLCAQHVK